MSIVYRSIKGSKLTSDEVDGNFAQLDAQGNTIISQTGLTLVSQDLTINANWVWKILGSSYTNTGSVVINIPFSSSGNERIDLIVANTSNTFERISGTESASNPVSPPTPAGKILVSYISVTDGLVGTPSDPLLGVNYVKKIFSSSYAYAISGANGILELRPDGSSYYSVTNSGLVSISGFKKTLITGITGAEEPYNNKEITIFNKTGVTITINHLENAAGNIPLFLKGGANLTFPANENITFLYGNSGIIEKFRSWSSGGGTYLESFQYNTTSLCIFNFPATSNWTQQGGFFGMGAYGSARGDSSVLDFLTLISSTASYGKIIGGVAPFDMELANNLSFVTPNLNLVGGDLKLGVGYIELDYALGTISNATVITETSYVPNANGSIDLKTDFATGITIPKGAIWLYSWAHTRASAVSSIYIQTMLNFKQV